VGLLFLLSQTAGTIRAALDDTSYSGHINFWSPESWTFFLRKNVQGSIETGFMSSGDIFAVIHESEANNRYR
jgi:hypothetical protein